MPRKSRPPPASPPRKRGNQSHVPTDEKRAAVQIMVAAGLLYPAIASAIGVCERTLRNHYREELDNGTAALSLIVLNAHVERIKAGDMRAIEWWEKARLGWSEKMVVDTGPQPLRVVVELVGDPPPAPLTIEHGKTRAPFDVRKHVELVG